MSSNIPWLTVVLVIPLGTAILLQLVPRDQRAAIKGLTVLGTLATASIVAGLLVAFNQHPSIPAVGPRPQDQAIAFQFEEIHSWIPAIGATYHLGLDGLSAWLLALDAFVFLLGASSSTSSGRGCSSRSTSCSPTTGVATGAGRR
ncbi:MAG: hypothetical protein E6J03_00160 [Chloroflexi bacterium]|nr:MAG: hypothetical protein E6J03_00160 [Chloroflexota bacterium]